MSISILSFSFPRKNLLLSQDYLYLELYSPSLSKKMLTRSTVTGKHEYPIGDKVQNDYDFGVIFSIGIEGDDLNEKIVDGICIKECENERCRSVCGRWDEFWALRCCINNPYEINNVTDDTGYATSKGYLAEIALS